MSLSKPRASGNDAAALVDRTAAPARPSLDLLYRRPYRATAALLSELCRIILTLRQMSGTPRKDSHTFSDTCPASRSSYGHRLGGDLDDTVHRFLNSRFPVRCVMAAPAASLSHTAALARLGHALSDPTRAGILLALREAPGYPSDLADALAGVTAGHVEPSRVSARVRPGRGCPRWPRSWYRLTDPASGARSR